MDWRRLQRSSSTTSQSPRSLILGASLAVCVLLSGCGIPQFVFFAAPELSTVTELPATIDFVHDVENDSDSFLGYELYYKFYDPDDVPAYEAAFASDRNAIEAASPGAVVSTLQSRSFFRIYSGIAGTSPTLTVPTADKATAFTFRISFADDAIPTDVDATASWTASTTFDATLLRDLTQLGTQSAVGFAPEDVDPSSDNDMPTGLGVPVSATIRMALVALAYGVDFETGTFATIYSQATVASPTIQIYY